MAHEDYVSFEQAQALKELGFDWECQAYFEDYLDDLNRHHRKFRFNAVANDMLHKDFCSAPTLAQAQKWLREVKELDIDITLFRNIDAREEPAKIKRYYNCEIAYSEDSEYLYEDFDTYEQALSAGISRALKLLKQENNGK